MTTPGERVSQQLEGVSVPPHIGAKAVSASRMVAPPPSTEGIPSMEPDAPVKSPSLEPVPAKIDDRVPVEDPGADTKLNAHGTPYSSVDPRTRGQQLPS